MYAFDDVGAAECDQDVLNSFRTDINVADPPKLNRLKCANYHLNE